MAERRSEKNRRKKFVGIFFRWASQYVVRLWWSRSPRHTFYSHVNTWKITFWKIIFAKRFLKNSFSVQKVKFLKYIFVLVLGRDPQSDAVISACQFTIQQQHSFFVKTFVLWLHFLQRTANYFQNLLVSFDVSNVTPLLPAT